MNWFIYILLCGDGSYYIGSTNNVSKRVHTHAHGKGGRYTRSHLPVRLLYKEKFNNKSGALKREAELKKLSKTKKKELIESGAKIEKLLL